MEYMNCKVYAFVDYKYLTRGCEAKTGNCGAKDSRMWVTPSRLCDFLASYVADNGGELADFKCYGCCPNTAEGTGAAPNHAGQRIIGGNVVDILADILRIQKGSTIFQIWTDERDIISRVLTYSFEHGMKVEIWAFKNNLPNNINTHNVYPGLKVKFVDDHFKTIIGAQGTPIHQLQPRSNVSLLIPPPANEIPVVSKGNNRSKIVDVVCSSECATCLVKFTALACCECCCLACMFTCI